MTAQTPDTFIYNLKHYSLLAVNPLNDGDADQEREEFFDPSNYGLQTQWVATNNYRGFHAYFSVKAGQLQLGKLVASVHDLGSKHQYISRQGPAINGVLPEYHPDEPYNNIYKKLNLPLQFSGELIIGRDFVDETCEHFAVPAWWKHRESLALTFKNGELMSVDDKSSAAVVYRLSQGYRIKKDLAWLEMMQAQQEDFDLQALFDEVLEEQGFIYPFH